MKTARGTRDIYGQEGRMYDLLISSFIDTAHRYDLEPMYTPIFEYSEVFSSVGETSDIVTKEMYTFADRNGEELALRPEGTAPVMRAIINNSLWQTMPFKCYYHGPMFRYERPQKGRYRQFHQAGIEILGKTSVLAQFEAIKMAYDWLEEIGLKDKLTLHINSLGDEGSRKAYRNALVLFLQDYQTRLSDESKSRLTRNPLRILDSKDEQDIEILQTAPVYSDFLTQESKKMFEEIKALLISLNCQFKENHKLVRGLDYYEHTVFEFIADDGLSILAGGCYGKIAKRFGLKEDIAGVGWAAGVDRLINLVPPIKNNARFGFIILEQKGQDVALKLINELRMLGVNINLTYETNIKKAMKKMNNAQVDKVLLLGESELQKKQITLKDMTSGEQAILPLLAQEIKALL